MRCQTNLSGGLSSLFSTTIGKLKRNQTTDTRDSNEAVSWDGRNAIQQITVRVLWVQILAVGGGTYPYLVKTFGAANVGLLRNWPRPSYDRNWPGPPNCGMVAIILPPGDLWCAQSSRAAATPFGSTADQAERSR
jgi:hypothetical protein